jgi:SpoVK/Ycf46/Vps4 family AAA+-type ATPase
MSSILFLLFARQQVEDFVAAHPQKEGWTVYNFCTDSTREVYLEGLADFLREKHPGAVKCSSMAKEPSLETVRRIAQPVSVIGLGSEASVCEELDTEGWFGSVEIEWQDSPIHIQSMFMEQCLAAAPLVLIAAKSNATLRSFLSALRQYGHAREDKSQEILVVNGINLAKPKTSWNDVVLQGTLASDIRRNVDGFFQSADKYRECGLPYRRGFLFVGPPGCGKTFTIGALANAVKAKTMAILPKPDLDADCVERTFHWASKNGPAILVLEDIDKMIKNEKFPLAICLNIIDGLKPDNGVLLIATTNEPQNLDPALLHRPSRFDRVWRFPLPKYEQRLHLLRTRGRGHFSDEVLDEVAKKSEGFSMAYVQEVVVNALIDSIGTGNKPGDANLLTSLHALKQQRRTASRNNETLDDHIPVGFCANGT